jgi:hypothetical protein
MKVSVFDCSSGLVALLYCVLAVLSIAIVALSLFYFALVNREKTETNELNGRWVKCFSHRSLEMFSPFR